MSNFPLDQSRIKILIAGILIIFIGLWIMTLDTTTFGMGFLGITLGPIVVLIGVLIPVFSLFKIKK
jgi:hypothetical protein